MADAEDLKSSGDFPQVGSTPTPGTNSLQIKVVSLDLLYQLALLYRLASLQTSDENRW